MWTLKGGNELSYSDRNECEYDIVWQINNWELWRNFIIWERRIHSISLVTIRYIIQWPVAWSAYRIIELTNNRVVYKYVNLYHVQFRFQCIKQRMNQLSKTQRCITTVGCNLTWWSSVSIKPSPISILLYVTAVYMNWVESIKENNLVFLESEGLNLPLLSGLFR
jgi:hypothetical protein